MTGVSVRKSGALKGATARLRKSGALKALANGYIRRSGALKQFYSSGGGGGAGAFGVALNPSAVVGYAAQASAATIFTQSCAVVVTGGLAPYTYAWAVSPSSGGTWSADTPSSSSTTFKCTGVAASVSYDATITCTVTDARGFSVTSDLGQALVENFGALYP